MNLAIALAAVISASPALPAKPIPRTKIERGHSNTASRVPWPAEIGRACRWERDGPGWRLTQGQVGTPYGAAVASPSQVLWWPYGVFVTSTEAAARVIDPGRCLTPQEWARVKADVEPILRTRTFADVLLPPAGPR